MERLKNPADFDSILLEFERRLNESKSAQEVSDWCMRVFVVLYKLLESKSWVESINAVNLCDLIVKLTKHTICTNVKDKQNHVVTICSVFRCFVKKNVSFNICNDVFNLIFKNPSIKMDAKYSKIYWIMLVDKLLLFENNNNVSNFKDLIDNMLSLIETSDILLFCKVNLAWLIKRCFNLFNNTIKDDLEEGFDKICIALNKSSSTCNITNIEDDTYECIYKNILYSITLIFENAVGCSRVSNNSINSMLKFSMAILASREDYHYHIKICNSIMSTLYNSIRESQNVENVFEDLIVKLDKSKKIYKIEVLTEFILALRKILSLTMLAWTKKSEDFWKNSISIDLQISLMKLVIFVLNILSVSTKQIVKCDNCKLNSAIHDALHLSTTVRYLIINSAKSKVEIIRLFPLLLNVFEIQKKFIMTLQKNKCPNWHVLWSAIQRNYHSDAVLLHSLAKTKESVDLFQLYYLNCMEILQLNSKTFNMNDFTRGLYNMSVSHLELNNYEESLKICYLCLILNYALNMNDDENTKYFKYAIQIKVRALEKKDSTQIDASDKIQSLNVWNACRDILAENETLFEYVNKIDFTKLLINELETYFGLWFSTIPVAGICASLMDLYNLDKNVNPKILGFHNTFDIVICCGMAVTLIGTQMSKFQNIDIVKFVKCTIEALEKLYNDSKKLSAENAFIVTLFYGNALKAHYECVIFDKVKNEPAPNVTLKASAPRQAPHHLIIHPDDTCDIAPTQHSLNLSTEDDILNPLLKSIEMWKKAIDLTSTNHELCNEYKLYINKTVEIMDIAVQILSLRGLDTQSIYAADITYSLALIINNRSILLRTVGFIIEHIFNDDSKILELIVKCNEITREILENKEDDKFIDNAFEYLLSLVIYYFNRNEKDKSITIITFVHNKILHDYFSDSSVKKIESIRLSYVKLIVVQSLFIDRNDNPSIDCISLLSNVINGFIESTDLLKTEGRNGYHFISVVRLWVESGIQAGKVAFMIGIPRRARAILRSVLSNVQRLLMPRTTAEILLLLAYIDFATERFDDCKVKIDAIDYILEEQNSTTTNCSKTSSIKNDVTNLSKNHSSVKNIPTANKQRKQFEMVLDVPVNKYSNDNLGGSPIFCSSPYTMPSFIDHQNSCVCNKCKNIRYFNIVLGITHIKAQLYFKTGEINIAQSYFEGALKLVDYLKNRMKYVCNLNFQYLKNLSCNTIAKHAYYKMFTITETQLNVDASYFFVTENDNSRAEALNEHALHLITLFPADNYLLMQSVHEQKMYFMQLKVFNEQTDTQSTLLDINNDFIAKLQLTPEKIVQNIETFKTPCNRKLIKPVNPIQRQKRNIVKVLTMENETPEFVRPTIKLDLDADDADIPEMKIKKSIDVENMDKTPAPKIRMQRAVMSESRVTRSNTATNGALKTPKNSMVRRTSPGSLSKIENNKSVINGAIKRSVRIKREAKTNLSPDVDLVNKYSIRRKL